MKGENIGSLNVYIQTNESKTLVWKRTGEQGNNWNFGQVGHSGDSGDYKVRASLLRHNYRRSCKSGANVRIDSRLSVFLTILHSLVFSTV